MGGIPFLGLIAMLAKPISDSDLCKLYMEIKDYERTIGCPHNKSSLVAMIDSLRMKLGLPDIRKLYESSVYNPPKILKGSNERPHNS